MIISLVILAAAFASFAALYAAVVRAVSGYENEFGFHEGIEPGFEDLLHYRAPGFGAGAPLAKSPRVGDDVLHRVRSTSPRRKKAAGV